MKIHFLLIFALVLGLSFIQSCKNQEDELEPVEIENLGGFVQKGPYLGGGVITISEMSNRLAPTDKNYILQIVDFSGAYSLQNLRLTSTLIEVTGTGYYFNEVSGRNSVAPLTLFAVSEVRGNTSINVNVLTHLEKSRIQALMRQEFSFKQSKAKAQREILNMFSINPGNIASSELLDISKNTEGNAILLAISVIMQGYRSESELTELLSKISLDLAPDGKLDNAQVGSSLLGQAQSLNLEVIRRNLETKYASLGVQVNIPDFERYIREFIQNSPFKPESPFVYRFQSSKGRNILNDSTTLVDGSINVSLACETPALSTLKIKLSVLDSNLVPALPGAGFWGIPLGSSTNWVSLPYNFTEKSQVFEVKATGLSADQQIIFLGAKLGTPQDTLNPAPPDPNRAYRLKIDYFESSQNPTKSRTIKVKY